MPLVPCEDAVPAPGCLAFDGIRCYQGPGRSG
jgi:hypothetical protein